MSTRLVGAVIMTHSDDTGLVLPPAIAPVQVVITPIWKGDAERAEVVAFAEGVAARLKGLRVKIDTRDTMKPGAKYFEWERKGVPLRLEIGPRDMAKGSVFAASRLGGGKFAIPVDDALRGTVEASLAGIPQALYDRAEARLQERTFRIDSYAELKERIDGGGFFVVNWCDDAANEATIKEETRATIRCYPRDGQTPTGPCFYSGRPATHVAVFARAY